MANEDLTVRLKADDQLTPTVKKATKAVEELEDKDVKVKVGADTKTAERDITGLLEKVDKLGASDAANLLLTTNAAQIGGEIADLVVKLDGLDAADPQVDITVANIAQLQGDLDQIQAKAKAINDTPIALDTTQATTGIDQIGRSADSSKSVLANMVGNATQDLGALGGVAGSAGVAIGQMGEYMADAAGSGDKLGQIIGSFGKVAVPIAGIAIATKMIADDFERQAKSKAFNAEQIEAFRDAFEETGSIVEALNKQLEETSELVFEVTGGFDAPNLGGDIAPFLATTNTTIKEFVELAHLGDDAWAQWTTSMADAGASAEDMLAVDIARIKILEGEAIATEAAALKNELLGTSYGEAGLSGEKLNATIEGLLGLHQESTFQEAADALKQWAEEAARAEEGARAFAAATGGDEWEMSGLAAGVSAMSSFNDMLFANDQQIIASEAAFKALNESVKENGANFDVTTEAGRNNQGALEGVARALEDDLAVAYQGANGDQDAFEQTAGRLAHDTLARLQSELGLSAEETFALGKELGLLPADLETRYELSGAEEAKAKIGLLQTAIDNLPKDVQTKVTQQIIEGDYQGALATVQGYYNSHPATVRADADTAGAERELSNLTKPRTVVVRARLEGGVHVPLATGGVAGSDGGIAGEAGPEFIRLPDGREVLLRGPAYVPPRTRVTSTRQTRQILNKGGLPFYANGTGAAVQVAAIWEQILRAVNRLGTLTEEGNDTAELAARSLNAVNLEEVSAEQANRIGALLEQLNHETVAGNKEAMDALSTELSVAVRELNPAAGPAATAPAAVAAEVVKAEAAKAKEDPNTAILEKISNTLLTIASWDKTSSSMLLGEFKYLIQAVQGGSLDPSIVRGAVMAIGAGSA